MRKLLFSLLAVLAVVFVSGSAFAASVPSSKASSANHCWQPILLAGGDTFAIGAKSVTSTEPPGGPKINFGKACTGCDGNHTPHMQVKIPPGKSATVDGVKKSDGDTVTVDDGATVTINPADTCDVGIDGDNVTVFLNGVNGGNVTCTPSSDGTLTASNTPNGPVLDIDLNGSGVQVTPLTGNIKVHN